MKQVKIIMCWTVDGVDGTRGQENYQILQFQRGEERGERGDVPSCRLDGLELVFHYLSSA